MVIRFCKLKEKEVINLCNGKRLGYVSDAELDINTGRIIRIFVPKSSKCFSFGNDKNNIVVPWQNIERIGDDAILVRVSELIQP
ncbi:MAG: YlmC/YmxH family sporulation protein [Ruminococcaceae bacterium]|nr:YlmC/YmxH family sporulation protein [Oscillospiraceae bacterium]